MLHDKSVDQYREYLKELSYPEYAYQRATDAASRDVAPVLDLSVWNDTLPPGVIEVLARALPKAIGSYALAQDSELTTTLAQIFGVKRDSIIITAGADDALRIASRYSIRPGTRVLIPTPCFGRYAYHAMINEATITYLPFDTYPYEFDISSIVDAANKGKADCVFIANPNSPTGHTLSLDPIRQLLAGIQSTVILDESLLPSIHSEGRAALISEYPDLFICGSFSKLYGLAGLRIGYLVANPIHTKQLRQLVSPFGVDALALAAAKYVLKQDKWLHMRAAAVADGIAVLRTINNPKVRVTHTQASVALLDYQGSNASLYQRLRDAGVLTVAGQEFPGLAETNSVRVIIKNIQDMQRLKRIVTDLT